MAVSGKESRTRAALKLKSRRGWRGCLRGELSRELVREAVVEVLCEKVRGFWLY